MDDPRDLNKPRDEITRTYTNGRLTVLWRAGLCVHCKACVTGVPAVFDTERRPWVDLTQATDAEITRQVGACPSGALSIG